MARNYFSGRVGGRVAGWVAGLFENYNQLSPQLGWVGAELGKIHHFVYVRSTH